MTAPYPPPVPRPRHASASHGPRLTAPPRLMPIRYTWTNLSAVQRQRALDMMQEGRRGRRRARVRNLAVALLVAALLAALLVATALLLSGQLAGLAH